MTVRVGKRTIRHGAYGNEEFIHKIIVKRMGDVQDPNWIVESIGFGWRAFFGIRF